MNAAGYESFLCGKMHYDNAHRYGFTEIGGNMNNNFMTGHGSRRAADDLGKPGRLSARFTEFQAANDSSIMRHDRAVTDGTLAFLSKREARRKAVLPAGRLPCAALPLDRAAGVLGGLPGPRPHARHSARPPGIAALELQAPAGRVRHGKRPGEPRPQGARAVSWPGAMVRQAGRQGVGRPAGQRAGRQHGRDLHGRPRREHGRPRPVVEELHVRECRPGAVDCELAAAFSRRPAAAGGLRLVDVVQTIADLGGGHTPDDWNGTSLCRWMDDAGRRGRTWP